MEKEDFRTDDLLKKLIQGSPLDSPSRDFVECVMDKVMENPVLTPVKKPFYFYLKSASPFILLGIFCLFIYLTSDFSFMNWFPGKDYYTNSVIPYFITIVSCFKAIFATKFFSIAFMIVIAGSILIIIDRLFSRKAPDNQIA